MERVMSDVDWTMNNEFWIEILGLWILTSYFETETMD